MLLLQLLCSSRLLTCGDLVGLDRGDGAVVHGLAQVVRVEELRVLGEHPCRRRLVHRRFACAVLGLLSRCGGRLVGSARRVGLVLKVELLFDR